MGFDGGYPWLTSFPSQTHLPGFVEGAEQLKAKGVQLVACLSVNDVFVTEEWGRAHKAEGKVSGELPAHRGRWGETQELSVTCLPP